jgi:hypothetical protein
MRLLRGVTWCPEPLPFFLHPNCPTSACSVPVVPTAAADRPQTSRRSCAASASTPSCR